MHRDLPEFLAVNNSNLIFCDTLRWKRKHSCLSLTRQLKFYEFANKQMLHCVDLNETCLRTIASKLQAYQGPRRKCFNKLNMSLDTNATNNTIASMMMNDSSRSNTGNNETSWGPSLLNSPSKDIEFGKYVYRNNQLYILLRCWDKLLIMKRFTNSRKQETDADADKGTSEHYELVAEYEQVLGFRLVHDKITYQTLVEITHTNGVSLKTDFQNQDNSIKVGDNHMHSEATTSTSLHGSSEFKQLLQRVNGLRSELQLHCAMTVHDFDNMRDIQTFGNAVTRSPLIDEKQLLTRFGDIWLRITADNQDILVLGVPLVNTAGTNTSTIARNIKPLIQITSDKDSSTLSCMSFHHRFYQLHHHHHLNSDNDISSSQYSDNQDENLRALAWYAINPNAEQQQLLPECKAVLLISLPLSQLVPYQRVDFFINYEVANNNNNTLISDLQIFLRSFSIKDLLSQRDRYTINFSNKMTLQQDFLAVIMTQAASCSLRITYQDHNKMNYEQFCQVLMMHFQFDLWNSCNNDNISPNYNDHDDNDNDMKSVFNDPEGITVYSNRHPSSIWHGTLILCRKLNDDNGGTYKWSIYARNNAKLGLFLSVLFQDLLKYKCNVSNVELMASNDWDPAATSIENLRTLRLEDVLRQELKVWHDCVVAAGKKDLKLQLYKVQFECDLIVASVIKASQVNVH